MEQHFGLKCRWIILDGILYLCQGLLAMSQIHRWLPRAGTARLKVRGQVESTKDTEKGSCPHLTGGIQRMV